MIFIINSTRGPMRFLTCVAQVTCLVYYNVVNHERILLGHILVAFQELQRVETGFAELTTLCAEDMFSPTE